jgi:hypothetical protein
MREKQRWGRGSKVYGKSKDGAGDLKYAGIAEIAAGVIFIREVQDEDRDKNIQ